MPIALLRKTYEATYTIRGKEHTAHFIVALECNRTAKTFHCLLFTYDYFLNSAINICNWPVTGEWTLERVAEALRIFHEEYLPAAKALSQLVETANVQATHVMYIENQTYVTKSVPSDCAALAPLLWDALQKAEEDPDDLYMENIGYTTRVEDTFAVCDAIHDAGYVEDPFPFIGATDAFGNPTPSYTKFYEKYLPTLYKMATGEKEQGITGR